MFKGKVSRTSHDGGLLVEFSGSCPALGTILVDSNNQYIGKVHGVGGYLNEAFIHVHSLVKSVSP